MPPSDAISNSTVQLAVIPGDGIGPEVTTEALKVLERATPGSTKFEATRYDLGAERYLATGEVLPDSVLAEIRGHDAILLGAVGGRPGDPSLPPGILERGLLLRLRFELDHYVNLRPSRIFPGVASPLADPGEVDFVVVREGTEGEDEGRPTRRPRYWQQQRQQQQMAGTMVATRGPEARDTDGTRPDDN
jgi:3-isopropylmalate dehydrogenase